MVPPCLKPPDKPHRWLRHVSESGCSDAEQIQARELEAGSIEDQAAVFRSQGHKAGKINVHAAAIEESRFGLVRAETQTAADAEKQIAWAVCRTEEQCAGSRQCVRPDSVPTAG